MTNPLQEELRPCTHCGPRGNLNVYRKTESDIIYYFVYCLTCRGQGPIADEASLARAEWNYIYRN